jgi:hypothetical protein
MKPVPTIAVLIFFILNPNVGPRKEYIGLEGQQWKAICRAQKIFPKFGGAVEKY